MNERWITKYDLKIKVESENIVAISNNLGFVLSRIDFKNACKIKFYLENEFLKDFVPVVCIPEGELINMIENTLIDEYDDIFKKARELNFVLEVQVLDYDEYRDEVNIVYIEKGQWKHYRNIIGKEHVEDYIENFIDEIEGVGE